MKEQKTYFTIFFCCIVSLMMPAVSAAQSGFVRASGTKILDPQGNNLIFRGIGTGNWMLQEGYMMGSANGATNGTQWDFKRKLTETIGFEKTEEFYTAWLDNHFTKADVDSMAAWGFNSVRPALHYKAFTLPIEDEPVAGQDTWLEDGFKRLDELMEWCAANKMYAILDMHGCPGAQGSDSNISDYDSSKPSLWENEENKRKLVALWTKIAERYANNPWIGGYDLINEPKWDALKNNGKNNKELWDLFKRLIDSIRTVDKNHLIFLAGNNWGNDYAGLPNISSWGGNIGLSFHKYWNYNNDGELDWILNLGKTHNVPVWLGETGENSNTWFADEIHLCEKNNVGWSFWPVKKTGINNILQSEYNADYNAMLNAWKNNRSFDATRAFRGVMQFAEAHNIKNCKINYDVIHAMITRPHTNDTKPFKNHVFGEQIKAVDYDLGPMGYAYYDTDGDANYHQVSGTYVNWNQGWVYRNDGVDIESCNEGGYNVGHIGDGEWLQYTMNSPEEKSYTLLIRYAGEGSGLGKVYLEINGQQVTSRTNLPATGGWQKWGNAAITNVIVPAGEVKIRFIFEKGNVNFNYFQFRSPREVKDIDFQLIDASAHQTKDEIVVLLNKAVSEVNASVFSVKVNGSAASISEVRKDAGNPCIVNLILDQIIKKTDNISISYKGESCKSKDQVLKYFDNYVVNTASMGTLHEIPCKVEAEDYLIKNGFDFENCSDTGGGKNLAFASAGCTIDYLLLAPESGDYDMSIRFSTNATSQIKILDANTGETLANKYLRRTGGWQNWLTETITIPLKKGKNTIRIVAETDGFNLNWYEFSRNTTALEKISTPSSLEVYPNPAASVLNIRTSGDTSANIALYDISGRQYRTLNFQAGSPMTIDVQDIPNGFYLLHVLSDDQLTTRKVIVKR